ncbi:MAG: AAA family ATPase [Campylobacterales bacterium]|nr:AAA family ATPase [Campylobacterales bacterium]
MLETLKEELKNNHVFLTGGGGVGKSYLTYELIRHYRAQGHSVVVLGSTGISAVHVNGQTAHSFFAFGIANDSETMLRNDKYNKHRLKELREILERCELLILDEISMVSASVMEMIRYRLDQLNFAGRLLFVGDFFQLPPVSKRTTNSNSLFGDPLYAFESTAWEVFSPKMLVLNQPKRTSNPHFFHVLGRVREGDSSAEVLEYLSALSGNTHAWEKDPTVLFGRNAEADAMNKIKLRELDAPLVALPSKETLHDISLHVKRLEGWKKNLPVQEIMELKVGARVLFCTNKWGKYMNGEHGIVREIEEDAIWVEKNGALVEVERHEFVLNEPHMSGGDIQEKPMASVLQFPLKLAYAITIHKSQGMSIDTLVCDIDHIFESSQFYVAISRAKEPGDLLLRYTRGDLRTHVERCIRVDERVRAFYATNPSVRLD